MLVDPSLLLLTDSIFGYVVGMAAGLGLKDATLRRQ